MRGLSVSLILYRFESTLRSGLVRVEQLPGAGHVYSVGPAWRPVSTYTLLPARNRKVTYSYERPEWRTL